MSIDFSCYQIHYFINATLIFSSTMEIYIFFSIMVIVKSLYILPFIYNWRLNYPHLFLDTNHGVFIVIYTIFLCFDSLPFLPALFLLPLTSLHMPCPIHSRFRDLIPPAVFSFVDDAIRAADPTGRISSLSRHIWKDEDYFIKHSSAVGLLLACYCRFYGLLSCFFLYLRSLGIYLLIRSLDGRAASSEPLDHESSLGLVPTEEPEKVECEESSSNPINGSIPSVKIEEVELEEEALMTVSDSSSDKWFHGHSWRRQRNKQRWETQKKKTEAPMRINWSS